MENMVMAMVQQVNRGWSILNNKFESENSYHYISFGEILLRVFNGAKNTGG